MRIYADLHTHSTASDGQYQPAQVVEMAKNAGIQVMALTDHDTVDGIPEAVETGKRLGIRVLPGIELSAKEYPNLHILGYQYSEACPHLRALCGEMKKSRDERKYRIIDYLKDKGISISLEEVEAISGGKIIGRPHFAQVMVKHGYVKDSREAFDRYLDTPEFQTIERFKPDAKTCIDTIHADGGIVSWAHPYQVDLDFDSTEKLAKQLADFGIDAMECFYPRHTPEQTCLYCTLTDQLGLQRTGGSDFHGERVKPDITLKKWPLALDFLLNQR